MERLIDADILKRHYSWWQDENKQIFDAIVDGQPTVDVVRCKECEHWHRNMGRRRRMTMTNKEAIERLSLETHGFYGDLNEAIKMAIAALQAADGDCISRWDLDFDHVSHTIIAGVPYVNLNEVAEIIRNAPAVAPEVRTGRWKQWGDDYFTWECTACGEPWTLYEGTPDENEMHFCPNCGARMDGTEAQNET